MENIIIGRNPVMEAIKSGRTIEKILIKKGKYEGSIVPLVKKAKEAGIIIQEVERGKLDAIADGGNHQGVAAYVSDFKYSSVKDILNKASEMGEAPFVVLCDKITDPHNLGAIIRTAECAGVHGIIIPKRGSVGVNGTVEKTSAGAAEHMLIAKVTNLAQTIDELKKQGMWFAAADMDGEEMYNVDLKGSLGIIIGSEGSGVSRLVKEKCDFIAAIPMKGKINSLNASVAGGILMYEALRQRRY
ncbi:MAG: 23S rRNA (guanosine(2251)-2'-O)-methyltransferase RlmB [bacterium]|nr:23S rRNA (guanosine(2251)-2'-O)-methyltransferase RlmB [bacterium]